MRYFFHLESETTLCLDHMGRDFADSEAARAYALDLARRLTRDPIWASGSLRVVDSANAEILCLPVDDHGGVR